MKMKKVNFGCGPDLLDGYENYDKEVDLNKKLPFKDNSIDEIVVYHVLEHILDKEFTMNEFERILKPKGELKIKLPIFAPMVNHKTMLHPRWYFYRYYAYPDSKFNLVSFKKGKHHFKGSVLGDLKNRFLTWIDLLRFNEYYWEMKKK